MRVTFEIIALVAVICTCVQAVFGPGRTPYSGSTFPASHREYRPWGFPVAGIIMYAIFTYVEARTPDMRLLLRYAHFKVVLMVLLAWYCRLVIARGREQPIGKIEHVAFILCMLAGFVWIRFNP